MSKDAALKLALEALEEAWYHVGTFQPTEKAIDMYDEARTAIKEALAQSEQEPVAWRGYNWGHSPDDWVYRDFDDPILDGNGNNVGQPLYTTPPQRKPLTDEEIRKAKHHMVDGAYHYSFQQGVRYAEAAHGIKENT